MAISLVQVEESEARINARTNLYLGATISFEGQLAPVRIRDLSAVGAKIESGMLPGRGVIAQLQRGSLIARGEVAWSDGARCGLRFLSPINLDAWLPGAATAHGQAGVDHAIAQVRAGNGQDSDGDSASLCELAQLLPARLAEEIHFIMRTLDGVQETLAAEPLVVARHGIELQHIDISVQLLGQIAGLLIAPDLQRAVGTIATEGLRRRLVRSPL